MEKGSVSEIPLRVEESWQSILDLLAEVCEVPAALIMKISPLEIEVFAKSSNEDNPYEVGATEELHGELYCERVLQTDSELLVPNALKDKEWKDNPDIALSMISYCGLPIRWPNGQHFGTICILDRKENSYSEVLRNLLAAFRDSIEHTLEMVEALRIKDKILAIAAHDLRSPLAQVESLIELIQLEEKSSSGNDSVNMVQKLIKGSVATMRELVDQLLKAQEVEALKDQFWKESFDLSAVLADCVAATASLLEAKDQSFVQDPSAPLSVVGSALYIKDALINLVSNASKYSPSGSEISMSIEADDKEISIHVVDEGPGFTPEDHENIFGKFQKLSAKPTNKETSTGLGLYIVKCIADAHGGSIIAQNAQNKGAHMVFSWPGIPA